MKEICYKFKKKLATITLQTITCSMATVETQEKGWVSMTFSGVLLLTFIKFNTFFYCFYSWL